MGFFFFFPTAIFSILVNGSPIGFVNSLWGLQHGDPLSPLLFVIMMEVFEGCIWALFSGVYSGRKGTDLLMITNLLYAYDALIFLWKWQYKWAI